MMVARRQKEDMRKYTGWARRTGKMYRSVDTGGRPVPESAKRHMSMKPYASSLGKEDADDGDSEEAE